MKQTVKSLKPQGGGRSNKKKQLTSQKKHNQAEFQSLHMPEIGRSQESLTQSSSALQPIRNKKGSVAEKFEMVSTLLGKEYSNHGSQEQLIRYKRHLANKPQPQLPVENMLHIEEQPEVSSKNFNLDLLKSQELLKSQKSLKKQAKVHNSHNQEYQRTSSMTHITVQHPMLVKGVIPSQSGAAFMTSSPKSAYKNKKPSLQQRLRGEKNQSAIVSSSLPSGGNLLAPLLHHPQQPLANHLPSNKIVRNQSITSINSGSFLAGQGLKSQQAKHQKQLRDSITTIKGVFDQSHLDDVYVQQPSHPYSITQSNGKNHHGGGNTNMSRSKTNQQNNPSAVYQWPPVQPAPSVYSAPSDQQVQIQLSKQANDLSPKMKHQSDLFDKKKMRKRRSVQHTPEKQSLPSVNHLTTVNPKQNGQSTTKVNKGQQNVSYEKFFISLDKQRPYKQVLTGQFKYDVTKTPEMKQNPGVRLKEIRKSGNFSPDPSCSPINIHTKQAEYNGRSKESGLLSKIEKAHQRQKDLLTKTMVHEATLSPVIQKSKKYHDIDYPPSETNTANQKMGTEYQPKYMTSVGSRGTEISQNRRYEQSGMDGVENDTSYLFPFIAKGQTKSSRNIDVSSNNAKTTTEHQPETFEAYVGYVLNDKQSEPVPALAQSKNGDYENESKNEGSISQSIENIHISSKSFPASMHKSHDDSSSRHLITQAKNTTAALHRNQMKSSNFSLKKCDITLSEDSEAPQRVAAPGNLIFSSVTTQKQKESNEFDIELKRQKLIKQLKKLNLSHVAQEQRRMYPQLNEISNEQLNSLIIQQIIALKEKEEAGKQHVRATSTQLFDSMISDKTVNEYSLPPMITPVKNHRQSANQIINHYNITINHNSAEPAASGASRSSLDKFSFGELQQIIMAQDQALQMTASQQLNQIDKKKASVMQRRGTELVEQAMQLQQEESDQTSSAHQSRQKKKREMVDPRLVYVKQPRVKRRPALDTNLPSQNSFTKNQQPQAPHKTQTAISDSTKLKDATAVEPSSSKQEPPIKHSQTTLKGSSSLTRKDPGTLLQKKDQNAVAAATTQSQALSGLVRENTFKRKAQQQRSIVNPKVDFQSLIEPNCVLLKHANKSCQRKRQEMESQNETEQDYCRDFSSLDVLVITFEGVLGAFVPCQNTQKEESNKADEDPDQKSPTAQSDTLLLRPAIKQALEQLLKNFKIVILTGDRSTVRQKAIIKALNKEQVPFDAFYRTDNCPDNFFTHGVIQNDLKSKKLQVLFLTATLTPCSALQESLKSAKPRTDFELLPIAAAMERFVIICVTHLFVEAGFDQGTPDLYKAEVCELTMVSQTISNFYMNANTFTRNELIREQRERQLKETLELRKKQPAGKVFARALVKLPNEQGSATEGSERVKSTTESIKKAKLTARRSLKGSESQSSIREPPNQLSGFQLLTNFGENSESLYPISFFQRRVEVQRTRDTFMKAFEKGQSHSLFALIYDQPEHFSKEILSKRLEACVMRLKSKLLKIKQAMRNVAHKESNADEKSFRVSQKNYELQRKQPAFTAFAKYNSHYFGEIYDECNVRLPCHPSKEQFEKLQSIYKSLQSRLDNLVNNTFPFSIESHKYYNLMYFDSSHRNKMPLKQAATVQRRHFQLNQQYQQQTQSMINELHRNYVRQNTVLTITTPIDDKQQSQQVATSVRTQSQTMQPTKLEKVVPDMISWLSEKQPTFSAANALPKTTDISVKKL